MSVNEHAKTSVAVVWYWILGVALILGLVVAVYALKPYFVQQDTRIIRESNPYITNKQAALRTFKADYDALAVKLAESRKDPQGNADTIRALEAQMAGIVRQMKQEADLIRGNVPTDIAAFLATL